MRSPFRSSAALCALCISSTLATPVDRLHERAQPNPKLPSAASLIAAASSVQASRAAQTDQTWFPAYSISTTFKAQPTPSSSTTTPSSSQASSIQPTTTSTSSTPPTSSAPASSTPSSSSAVTSSAVVSSATRSSMISSSSKPSSSSTKSSAPKASTSPMSNFWIGGNSYYLHTYPDAQRRQVLDQMNKVGMKVVRIFISHVYANNKGSPNVAVYDVEPVTAGVYDDTILLMVDKLMADCEVRGMKLLIALHDRYALGFWDTDAYALQFGIVNPGSSGAQQVADATAFYTTTAAKVLFDARIKHILNHRNKIMGNKRWADLGDAIYAFEPENEPMGHMNFYAGWTCDRASTIKSQLPKNSPILVSTGGGITLQASLASWAYSCPSFDIVSAHDYGTDASVSIAALQAGQAAAKKSGKTVMFGEWGASGVSKATIVNTYVQALANAGIPHMIWEITLPGAGTSDFEIWTTEPSWQSYVSNLQLNIKAQLQSRSLPEEQLDTTVVPSRRYPALKSRRSDRPKNNNRRLYRRSHAELSIQEDLVVAPSDIRISS